MYKILIFLCCLSACPHVHADEALLLQRIVALENRLAKLEQKLGPVLEQERVKAVVQQQKERARERMLLDAEYYSRGDLTTVEKLYQSVGNNWKTPEARKTLKQLVQRYPRSNRTGCAILYLGQMSEGNEQISYLKTAIEKHETCFYGNGVQVGAYARLYLAMRYKKEGENDKADTLFNEIQSKFPDAVDHKGHLLSTHFLNMH